MKRKTAQQPAGRRRLLVLWLAAALLAALLPGCSCSKNSTGPQASPTLSFTVEAGVIEAWLTVQVENAQPGQQVVVTRDGAERLRIALSLSNGAVAETTVVDTGLQPAHSYSYAAALWQGSKRILGSETATTATLDTTSHNFQWEIVEFPSPFGSGVLYDVAIINENDIWAVGEIYSDSAQPALPYNAVHWDGSQWELKRILQENGNIIVPVRGIWHFSESNIWLAAGSIYHWNGVNATLSYLRDINTFETVEKLWANSPSDIYGVGGAGLIVHYNGRRWRRIESGTELPIQDIWGAWNQREGKYEILAVASNKFLNEGKALLRIEGTRVSAVPDSGLSWSLSGVWFVPGKRYYIAGDGIYPSMALSPIWFRDTTFPAIYKDAICGTGLNNIAVSGSNGLLSHFNGNSWKHYLYNELPFFSGRYYGVDVEDNCIVAVGYINRKAIITMGWH